jgi:hypothetical protein
LKVAGIPIRTEEELRNFSEANTELKIFASEATEAATVEKERNVGVIRRARHEELYESKAVTDLLKKIDSIYVNWGTPPSDTQNLSSAGPPLVEYPAPLSQRAAQILGAIENTSGPPSDYEMSMIDALAQRIPPAAEAVRKLINEDLAALNNAMREAKVPYIQPPGFGGGGGQRPGGDIDDDDDDPDNDNY